MMGRAAVCRFGVDVGAVVTRGGHARVRGRLPSDATHVRTAVPAAALSRVLLGRRLEDWWWTIAARMRGHGRSMMVRT